MATATQFFGYWALAFGTLCAGLVLLNIYYNLIDCDLELHSVRKETVIAVIASAVQAAGFWFSESLFPGHTTRTLMIPMAAVGLIYWISHLEDWSGLEIGGIAYFQAMIMVTGYCIFGGQLTLAAIFLATFAVALLIIASVAKSL